MKVIFHNVDEWLEELAKDDASDSILRGIVRLTFRNRQSPVMPIISVSVFAAYSTHWHVVELEYVCGEVMPGSPQKGDGNEVGKKIMAALRTRLEDYHVEVRAGAFQP